MKNILTVVKKELLRVFKDPRLIFVLLLPGIMIYLLYSFMGNAFISADQTDRDAVYNLVTVNLPAEIEDILKSEELELKASYTYLTAATAAEVEQLLAERGEGIKSCAIDVLIIFDANFSQVVASGGKPALTICFNPGSGTSIYAYEKVSGALQIYGNAILAQRGVDTEVFSSSMQQIYDEKEVRAQGLAMLIPFLVITLLFSGCMAVAPDSIAGEKERGTFATILITPIKRGELALGKVFALSILASINALSSFVGLMLSLPKMMGNVDISGLYVFGDYLLILLVLISTVLLIIGVMSILSSYAKTTQEASMLIMPFMFLSMLVGISSMLSSGAATQLAVYLIPLYNSVQALISILTFKISAANLITTFVSNLVYVAVSVFVLTKLFNSEKVMFSK